MASLWTQLSSLVSIVDMTPGMLTEILAHCSTVLVLLEILKMCIYQWSHKNLNGDDDQGMKLGILTHKKLLLALTAYTVLCSVFSLPLVVCSYGIFKY